MRSHTVVFYRYDVNIVDGTALSPIHTTVCIRGHLVSTRQMQQRRDRTHDLAKRRGVWRLHSD